MVDVGLLHHLEELARISGERLDVAALPFGIDGVERQRALARAGEAGDHGQRLARDIDVDILQIVLARAADGDVGEHRQVFQICSVVKEGRAGRQRERCEMGSRGG